ncbi:MULTISPECIES: potassium channel family protein [Halolamina]|uniref:Trk K+ transport system, NAD-binding component n=1 Tax=Halolamina pelagica TaxID=699431 RepID=A0A1I5M335_9EURY|nr:MULTISPECIES: NAD-binding protein [Halolamina]NHX35840.1 TrkA family potassium uptake protein [Halolamina sp. R1-12]SFP03883.1 Trk K+ transport system, NAD-binding component [Halolamina pelagica]
MANPARRAGLYLLGTVAVMLVYAVLYQFGMARLEGIDVRFIESLHVVAETFTTVGYGEQAEQWESTAMLALMIAMQFTGVALIFLTLPAFVLPLFAEALASGPPRSYDDTGHVVICSFSPTVDTLVTELGARGKSYVVVESHPDTVESLQADGVSVVQGDPEDGDTLAAVSAADADAVVAAAGDETNASVILAAQHVAPETRVLSLVEDETHADYHRYAGADEVIQPRNVLGGSLAGKASAAVSTELDGAVEIAADLEISELLIQRGSPLDGATIGDCGVHELTGTNIVGAWFSGEFVSPPGPDRIIDEHTVLLVVGPEDGVETMKRRSLSQDDLPQGDITVAGYGVVGSAVAEAVTAAGLSVTIVDIEDLPGVDVVGDVTDPMTLEEAEVASSEAIVLALSDDTTALFAALVAKQVAPETGIIARANEGDSTPKLYRAGAKYVLSLPTVSGRMLASKLLDEEVITPETQVEVVRRAAPALVGRTIGQADVRARTGCTVIAVERDGRTLTDVDADLRVRDGDTLVVAGDDDAIDAFAALAT